MSGIFLSYLIILGFSWWKFDKVFKINEDNYFRKPDKQKESNIKIGEIKY